MHINRLLIALLFCFPFGAFAAELKLAPGFSAKATATGTVTADANGNPVFTLDADSVITIGGVIPGPGPIPTPSGTLTETVKTATSSVPAYADKQTHQRAMAFGMTFLSQATSGAEVAKSRDTVRKFCDAAVGADAAKWAGWWSAVDAKLNSMALTPTTYTAALGEMSQALTADLPATANAARDVNGNQTFGLNPEFIRILMEILLPLLLKLLGLGAIIKTVAGLA